MKTELLYLAGGIVAGAATSGLAVYAVLTKKYNADIENLRAMIEAHKNDICERVDENVDLDKPVVDLREVDASREKSKINLNKPEIGDYVSRVEKMNYAAISTPESGQNGPKKGISEGDIEDDEIRVCSEEEYSSLNGHEKHTITYYEGNDICLDEDTQEIVDEKDLPDNFKDMLGKESLFVVNEKLGVDFEIVFDDGEYDYGE